MDFPQIQTTSFIPKTRLTSSTYQARGFGLGILISLLLLVVSGGLFGGVYFYRQSLQKEIDGMISSLEKAKKAFEPNLAVELGQLTSLINGAKSLLPQHGNISEVFKFINANTLSDVRFSDFKYIASDKGISAALVGEAKSYTTVALQAKLFEESDFIDRAMFSNFNLKEGGKVGFNVEIIFKPSLLVYKP